MSVYHEAFKAGRITPGDCIANPGRNRGIARALRAVKRREAEERNAKTPDRRRKAVLREEP